MPRIETQQGCVTLSCVVCRVLAFVSNRRETTSHSMTRIAVTKKLSQSQNQLVAVSWTTGGLSENEWVTLLSPQQQIWCSRNIWVAQSLMVNPVQYRQIKQMNHNSFFSYYCQLGPSRVCRTVVKQT